MEYPPVQNDIRTTVSLTDEEKLDIYTEFITTQDIVIDNSNADTFRAKIIFLARFAFCERILVAIWSAYAAANDITDNISTEIMTIAYDKAGMPFFAALLGNPTLAAMSEEKRTQTIKLILNTILFHPKPLLQTTHLNTADMHICQKIVQLATTLLKSYHIHTPAKLTLIGHIVIAHTCVGPSLEKHKPYIDFFDFNVIKGHIFTDVFCNPQVPIDQITHLATTVLTLRKTQAALFIPFFETTLLALAQTTLYENLHTLTTAVPISCITDTSPEIWHARFSAISNNDTMYTIFLLWLQGSVPSTIYHAARSHCRSVKELQFLDLVCKDAQTDDDEFQYDDDDDDDDEEDGMFTVCATDDDEDEENSDTDMDEDDDMTEVTAFHAI